jgi:hypothetical protein
MERLANLKTNKQRKKRLNALVASQVSGYAKLRDGLERGFLSQLLSDRRFHVTRELVQAAMDHLYAVAMKDGVSAVIDGERVHFPPDRILDRN